MNDTLNNNAGEPGLSALLDFGFNRFITVSIIRLIYMLGLALIALIWLIAVISGFTQGTAIGIGGLFLFTFVGLIEVIFFRVWLELIVVIFRIGENTTKMAAAGSGPAAPAQAPGA